MDRMNLRLTADKPVEKVKPKTLEELSKQIAHYESLYARTKQPPVLEMINNLKEEHLALEIKSKPDQWKRYNSILLGGVMFNMNMTKEEVHCSDGAFYTFDELANIPKGLGDEKLKLIHQVKLFGCKESQAFQEPIVYETI